MKILVADKFDKAGLDGLHRLGCEVVARADLTADTMAAAVGEVRPAILVVRSTKVQRPAIEAGVGVLRGIVRAGAGVDNIDIAAARAAGIAVCNCPGMNAVAVAELAMGLLLACDRRIVDQTLELRAGRWNKKEYARTGPGGARGLKGTTLGIVGLGAIGRAVALRARAFEMDVLSWSKHSAGEAAELGIGSCGSTRPELLAMLARCDAVTVHVSANPETRHLCDGAFFGAMKPGSIFVNTSRGTVVDEAALRAAVRERGIRAGLDVYEQQPAEGQAPFACETVQLPGVYGTHHSGASTEQAQLAVASEAVRIVDVYMRTGRFENTVD